MNENYENGVFESLKRKSTGSKNEDFRAGQKDAKKKAPFHNTRGLTLETIDNKNASVYVILNDQVFIYDQIKDITCTWHLHGITFSNFEKDRGCWPTKED